MKRLLLLFLLLTPSAWAAVPMVFCELASLPVLPLAADGGEHLSPEELLERVATSYRGLLEFAGEGISEVRLQSLLDEASPEKFFEPVQGRDQRSVALSESLAKLGDWVMLEAEDLGLTQPMIAARLREVVRAHLKAETEERERNNEVREARADPGRVTTTGHMFVRDYRFPKLGEAWRDPDGMVWGDVVRDDNGDVLKMRHADALKYCQEIGATLPGLDDFVRLREYMGAQPGTHEGYRAQILPGLIDSRFWSLSIHPERFWTVYIFFGTVGDSGLVNIYVDHNRFSVRCVRR